MTIVVVDYIEKPRRWQPISYNPSLVANNNESPPQLIVRVFDLANNSPSLLQTFGPRFPKDHFSFSKRAVQNYF